MTDLTEQLEKSVKDLKHRNENLQLALKTYELPEIQKILIDWRTGELDRKFNKLEAENKQLKDIISKMCMELVAPDDDMSNGLADYFNQDLILEIHEVLK